MTQDTTPSPDIPFPGSGIDSRLRAALNEEANRLAASHSIPIVMPVKEILSAMYRVLADVPRVPDYDHELAGEQAWRTATGYSPSELFPDPSEFQVVAREALEPDQAHTVQLTVRTTGDERVFDLDLSEAEGLFLAGLAAVLHLKRHRQ